MMKKVILVMRLVRWPNLLIIIVTQYFAAIFLAEANVSYRQVITDPGFFLLCLSTVLIAAGGYIINDYYDIKIDYLNKPDRVIIGKGLNRRSALFVHVIVSVLGVFTGLLAGWKIGVTSFFAGFLLWLYSNQLKRLPFLGNFSIALLTGMSIYMVSFYYKGNSSLVLAYSLFGFFSTIIREIIKDIEDLKGDETFGCKTLPILWGIRRTKIFIFLLISAFAAIFIIIIRPYQILMLYFYLVLLTLPLIGFVWKLAIADTKKEFTDLSRMAKIIMILGIGSMVFFKLY
jgi:4-hydroxybenzoate polyprenyltransferase